MQQPGGMQQPNMMAGPGGNAMQLLVQELGKRPAAVLVKFLEEMQQAEMIPSTFMPDPQKTQFTWGGGTIQLRVQALNPGTKAVQHS
jgi:hypothetical protein